MRDSEDPDCCRPSVHQSQVTDTYEVDVQIVVLQSVSR